MILNFDDNSFARQNISYLSPDKSSAQIRDGNVLKERANSRPSVLIFGDDKEIRFLLRTVVELWNYDCEEAENVEQALRLASQKSFSLVLMDTKLMMPDSLAEMRTMKKFTVLENLPFILLSGHIQDDVRLSAIAAGAHDFFVKPINLDHLEKCMESRIAESDRMREGL